MEAHPKRIVKCFGGSRSAYSVGRGSCNTHLPKWNVSHATGQNRATDVMEQASCWNFLSRVCSDAQSVHTFEFLDSSTLPSRFRQSLTSSTALNVSSQTPHVARHLAEISYRSHRNSTCLRLLLSQEQSKESSFPGTEKATVESEQWERAACFLTDTPLSSSGGCDLRNLADVMSLEAMSERSKPMRETFMMIVQIIF